MEGNGNLGLEESSLLLYTWFFHIKIIFSSKERTARRKTEEFPQDPRPPILYLRSFDKDDSVMMQFIGIGDLATTLLNHPMASGLSARNEEQLASTLADIGPMVALGRPGKNPHVPGAVRIDASGEPWKDVIDTWLTKAQLVIVRIGITEGLWWETKRVLEAVPRKNLLFYMLGTRRTFYDSAMERMRAEFRLDLPRFAEIQHWGRVSGFFIFETDGNLRFLPLAAPLFRVGINAPLKVFFHYTLRPIYKSLGIIWVPTPIAISKIFVMLYPFSLYRRIGAFWLIWHVDPISGIP